MRRRPRKPTECREIGKMIQAYLDAELDDDRRRMVAEHLERCRDCGLDAASYARLKQSVASMRRPAPDLVARLRDFGESLMRE